MQRLARSTHLREFLQGLRERMHVRACGGGQKVGANVGAARGHLHRPAVVWAGQPQEAASGFEGYPALHYPLQRLAALTGHLHRVEQTCRMQHPDHGAVQADAVGVGCNGVGANAHEPGGFEPGARRDGLDLIGLARDAADRVHRGRAARNAVAQAESGGCLGPAAYHRLRQRAIVRVGGLARVPAHDLGKQGVGWCTARLAQHQCGYAAALRQFPVGGCAVGKELDLGRHAALSGGDHRQFQKRAAANQDLAAKGIGLGQHPLAVARQVDAPGFAQVGDPRLAVVRIGRQQRMGQHEATQVGLAIRLLSSIRYIPPPEDEVNYYRQLAGKNQTEVSI